PRGIHRHYARLSIVTFPDGETDCRVKWPPECGGCCTINVAPGENIQAAIDSLPIEGGCVCLKTGVHNIGAAIQISSSRIILRGESPGTIVRASNLAAMLQIGGAGTAISDIVVEGIRFEALGAPAAGGAILYLSQCSRVRIEHCELAATSQQLPMYAGIWIDNASEIDIVDNRFKTLMYGIWVKNCKPRLRIVGNLITGQTAYQFGYDKFSCGQYGVYIDNDVAADCRIEGNQFADFWTAVYLRHGADGSLVSGNRILRSQGTLPGTMPGNITELRQYLDERLYAIVVEVAGCVVRDNYIDLRSAAWGGVRVTGAEVTVAGNTLEANDAKMGTLRPATIYCLASATQGMAADHAVISDNQAIGPQLGIVVSRVNGVQIERNHIDGGPAASWFGLRIDDSTDTLLRDNVLREIYFAIFLSDGERNQVTGNNVSMTAMGISATNEAGLEAAHNTVQSALFSGIGLYVKGAAVLHNRVLNCGYFGVVSIGIAVLSEDVYSIVDNGALVRIEGCEVIDTGISADGSQATTANAVGIGGGMAACEIINNRVGYTQTGKMDVQKEHRALLLIGPFCVHYSTGPGEFAYMFGSALIEGNHFRGPGKTSLVELMRIIYTPNIDSRFEKVTFNNNLCDHLSAEANTQAASVRLWGGHLIAMGNHVKAAANVNAMSLANRKAALMGNVTTGDYTGANNVTPLPLTNFNVRV
ncbi:MAG: right-handed parallel beta-helix repeat-containing protein, partial [Gallionella sp.]|nr:right-handed parallel beta-helix repeat-containing protein [Gallionella sp.]